MNDTDLYAIRDDLHDLRAFTEIANEQRATIIYLLQDIRDRLPAPAPPSPIPVPYPREVNAATATCAQCGKLIDPREPMFWKRGIVHCRECVWKPSA